MSQQHNLKRQAFFLTSARLFEAIVQLFIPIVLIRLINSEEFGMYRLLWLTINTIMVLAPLGIPASLLYFFPNFNSREKNKYLVQTILFLFISGAIVAIIIAPWNPYLPTSIKNILAGNELLVPFFLFLWIVTHALDFIPNALQENIQQAVITIFLTILRSTLIISAAIMHGDLHHIILSLVIFVYAKYIILIIYIAMKFDARLTDFSIVSFKNQFTYSFPFGITNLVYALRKQGEQWIVAFLFAPSLFGAFSLAAMVILPFDIIRSSISNVIMPRMSLAFAQGNKELSVEYNKLFNIVVNLICFPLLVYIYVFCEEIVVILFGDQFKSTTPVLYVYLIQMFLTLEVGNLMRILEQGKAAFKYNSYVLFISLPLSFFFSNQFGLPGAAIGGVTGGVIVLFVELVRISRVIRLPVKSLIYWFDSFLLFVLSWLSILPGLYIYWYFANDFNIYLKLIVVFTLQVLCYLALLFVFGEAKRIQKLSNIGKSQHG